MLRAGGTATHRVLPCCFRCQCSPQGRPVLCCSSHWLGYGMQRWCRDGRGSRGEVCISCCVRSRRWGCPARGCLVDASTPSWVYTCTCVWRACACGCFDFIVAFTCCDRLEQLALRQSPSFHAFKLVSVPASLQASVSPTIVPTCSFNVCRSLQRAWPLRAE